MGIFDQLSKVTSAVRNSEDELARIAAGIVKGGKTARKGANAPSAPSAATMDLTGMKLPDTPAAGLPGDAAENTGPKLRLFHGSPHDFDRFSMDKIGTGEGAQAYGHGLYFAENEGIAKSYRDALSRGIDDTGMAVRIDGNPISNPTVDQVRAARFGPEQAADGIKRQIEAAQRRLATASDTDELGIGISDKDMVQMDIDALSKRLDDVQGLAGRIEMAPAGRMYEVNVNANPEDFLDWGAPLSAQPAKVRDVLGPRVEALRQAGAGLPQDPIGEALWRVAHPQGGFDKTDFSRSVPEQATERLREAGIPGIRYLDAGSRGAGDGSRNYVVFDENLINIVRKYGIAGAAAMLGVSALDVEQAMAQGQQRPQGLLGVDPQDDGGRF